MMRLRQIAVLLPLCTLSMACGDGVRTETISASLSNTETFSYSTVGGDEEGAGIALEPKHALVSEIRRGPETGWIATYVYQPTPGYIGSDRVRLEILTGSDGASPPDTRRLLIELEIHE